MYNEDVMNIIYEAIGIKNNDYVIPKVSPKDAVKTYISTFKKKLDSYKIPKEYKINNYKLTISDLKKSLKFEKIDSKLLNMEFDKYNNTFVIVYFHIENFPKISYITKNRDDEIKLAEYCTDILYIISDEALKSIGDNSYIDARDGDHKGCICAFAIKKK